MSAVSKALGLGLERQPQLSSSSSISLVLFSKGSVDEVVVLFISTTVEFEVEVFARSPFTASSKAPTI